jgi:hypothetical protein
MWMILLMLILALNGGAFAGMLLFSAIEAARFDQLLDMIDKTWRLSSF